MKRFNKDEAEKEKIFFNDIFEDITRFCKKINQAEYLVKGEFPIIDQGKNKIAGFSYLKNEVYRDTPVIIFGDHTRVIKFIDFPFLIGADGVKVLKNRREEFLDKYLYYALKYFKIPNTGYNRHFKWLKEFYIYSSNIETQKKIVKILDIIQELIEIKNKKLKELDNLSKCLFVEMFGDPILNEKNWSKKSYEEMSTLITDGEHQTPKRIERGIYLLSARNIYNHHLKLEDVDYITEEEYIRISKRIVPKENDILISCSGSIGRVCLVPKNLKFQLVRSVALIRVKENINPIFMEYLIASDFTQNQIKKETTKSSQANLFQGKIKKLVGIIPPIELQNKFAERIKLIEKSKFEIQNSIDETQKLFDSLMDKYFG